MLVDIASIIAGCKKYYLSVRDASKTMNAIMSQVGSLAPQLELLEDILEQDNRSANDLRMKLCNKEILQQMWACLQDLKKLVDIESGVSDPYHNPTRPRLEEAYKRLTWPITKQSKAEDLLVQLERHKSTISMILSMQNM